ncbi:MAG: 3'(2'),5'-bisphosphate nucleotidase CysQ, partial [Cyclobacteriaceae bacterium]|nr:3'(2'),5'-bisphosphate nucleotidase CysQ [Cyclobacteriaceae bacterium]
MKINIEILNKIAIEAGNEILNIYNDKSLSKEVEHKSDNSPLTLADKASNELIVKGLKDNFPEIPILSEEEKSIEYSERKNWNKFWLVDPLDGTKEFIKRNGEFTVNIALIENGFPTFGIIYAPILEKLYIGDLSGKKAFMIDEDHQKIPLKVNNSLKNRIAVGSRSHSSEEEANLLNRYDVVETISVGSSLKFCMIAEGKADIYYRHGPTMEWDTGAGQAIVEAA